MFYITIIYFLNYIKIPSKIYIFFKIIFYNNNIENRIKFNFIIIGLSNIQIIILNTR